MTGILTIAFLAALVGFFLWYTIYTAKDTVPNDGNLYKAFCKRYGLAAFMRLTEDHKHVNTCTLRMKKDCPEDCIDGAKCV